MGIKHLRTLLNNICEKSGVCHFGSVSDFLKSEKKRLYRNTVYTNRINNPARQMQIKQSIENKPYFVGIDASLYAARYKRVFRKIEYGFLRQIMLSLSSGMIPIYIFDGCAPEQKRKTITNRQNKKQKIRDKIENFLFPGENKPSFITELSLDELVERVNATYCNMHQDSSAKNTNIEKNEFWNKISNTDLFHSSTIKETQKNISNYLLYDNVDSSNEYKEFVRLTKKSISTDYDDIRNLKNFFDLLKIPYVTATREADDLMAFLYKEQIIQACQSDDMDMLPKGCGNVIQISSTGVLQFLLPEILQSLDLKYEQFIDLCILLGSDYYTSYLPKIKPMELYNIFKYLPNPSLESFITFYADTDPNIAKHLEHYQLVRNSFLVSDEKYSKKFWNCDIAPFSLGTIIDHLTKIGINLNKNDYNKIRLMVKNANESIQILKYSLPDESSR